MALRLRELTKEEHTTIEQLLHARKVPAGKLKRAQIVWLASQGLRTPAIAVRVQVSERMVRNRLHRFNEQGLQGLEEAPRSGRPVTYQPEVVSEIIQTALSKPRDLGEDYATWTLDRLVDYLSRVKGIRMKRSRISEIFIQEGLSWRHEESWFGQRVDPDFARKRGAITSLYAAPPERSVTVCLDEMGPQAVKSYPGKHLVYPEATETRPAGRAKQQIDYGRRGKAGYVFGALKPTDGEVFTATYTRRKLVNWIDFLQQVEEWIPKDLERVYAVLDNLSMHRAMDVLFFNLAYPRWEFVFQPTAAAYLNLIEPWWKTLKSLAFKGRRFESWQQIEEAVRKATTYWNSHRHPYVWGRRRRHQPHRKPGIARLPIAA
jgi:transposase